MPRPDPSNTSLHGAVDDELVDDLARGALSVLAPEELDLFGVIAPECHAHPERGPWSTTPDERVGFGLDLALVTPYVIAASGAVVNVIMTMLSDVVTSEGTPVLRSLVRDKLRRPGVAPTAHPEPTLALTADQARHVRETAHSRARALGLADEHAGTLADAIVGALVTR